MTELLSMVLRLFQWMTPPENAKPEEVRRWREKTAAGLSLLTLALVGVIWGAEARYMQVAEAEEVHQEIRRELRDVQRSLDSLVLSERERTIRDVRRDILSLQERACWTEGTLRSTLNSQVGELRSQYMALTGEEFPIIRCQDLTGAAE